MSEHIVFNPQAPDKDTYVKLREMDLNSGILGKFFGTSDNVSTYIAGVVVIAVVITGLIASFFPGGTTAVETWKIITPIVTMILGFLFGKQNSN